jgi:hypothetical protein
VRLDEYSSGSEAVEHAAYSTSAYRTALTSLALKRIINLFIFISNQKEYVLQANATIIQSTLRYHVLL